MQCTKKRCQGEDNEKDKGKDNPLIGTCKDVRDCKIVATITRCPDKFHGGADRVTSSWEDTFQCSAKEQALQAAKPGWL